MTEGFGLAKPLLSAVPEKGRLRALTGTGTATGQRMIAVPLAEVDEAIEQQAQIRAPEDMQ